MAISVLGKRPTLAVEKSPNRQPELENYIALLENGGADSNVLQKLVFICLENPALDALSPLSPESVYPMSPSPFTSSLSAPALQDDLWEKNKTFDKFLSSLIGYLVSAQVCPFYLRKVKVDSYGFHRTNQQ